MDYFTAAVSLRYITRMSVYVPSMEVNETASLRRNKADFHFGATDWTVFVLMLVASVLIGVGSAVRDRRRATIHEYLLGGRNMPPMAVGLSLLGGWISAISILGKGSKALVRGQLT